MFNKQIAGLYGGGKKKGREKEIARKYAMENGVIRPCSYRVAVLRVPVLVILKLPCTSGCAYELRSLAFRATNGTLLFREITERAISKVERKPQRDNF